MPTATLEVLETRVKVVDADASPVLLVVEEQVRVLEVGTRGLQGPKGDQGDKGDTGTGIQIGLLADRPAAPDEGTIYVATDTNEVSVYLI